MSATDWLAALALSAVLSLAWQLDDVAPPSAPPGTPHTPFTLTQEAQP